MTVEERLAGLEKECANLAEMVSSLCWGSNDHNKSFKSFKTRRTP